MIEFISCLGCVVDILKKHLEFEFFSNTYKILFTMLLCIYISIAFQYE